MAQGVGLPASRTGVLPPCLAIALEHPDPQVNMEKAATGAAELGVGAIQTGITASFPQIIPIAAATGGVEKSVSDMGRAAGGETGERVANLSLNAISSLPFGVKFIGASLATELATRGTSGKGGVYQWIDSIKALNDEQKSTLKEAVQLGIFVPALFGSEMAGRFAKDIFSKPAPAATGGGEQPSEPVPAQAGDKLDIHQLPDEFPRVITPAKPEQPEQPVIDLDGVLRASGFKQSYLDGLSDVQRIQTLQQLRAGQLGKLTSEQFESPKDVYKLPRPFADADLDKSLKASGSIEFQGNQLDKNGDIHYAEYRITDHKSPAYGANVSVKPGESVVNAVLAKEKTFRENPPKSIKVRARFGVKEGLLSAASVPAMQAADWAIDHSSASDDTKKKLKFLAHAGIGVATIAVLAKPFYSNLLKVATEKLPQYFTEAQARATLEGKVKNEEMKWMDFDGYWQGLKPGEKGSLKGLLTHLAQNEVNIKEVTKSANTEIYPVQNDPRGEYYDKQREEFIPFGEANIRANQREPMYDSPNLQLPGGTNYREYIPYAPESSAYSKRLLCTSFRR